MQLLIPQTELINYKSRDLISLKCEYCQKTFYRTKNYVLCAIKGNSHSSLRFCSNHCKFLTQYRNIKLKCDQCNKEIIKKPSHINGFVKHFCSQSCAAIYHNIHKTTGYRRSKLEFYLENHLKKEFPNLNIQFNDRKTIGFELDIYIPSLNLAFEINGIHHYQPIYKNYQRTIEIDQLKPILCNKLNIQLHTFNVSSIKIFQPIIGEHILKIIQIKMAEASGHDPHTIFQVPSD